jgi:DNA sulfur modification protein DndD
MIIKEIIIENYLCYYGQKKFALANGLNIILGKNGEGKTKFYEALDWLFNGDSRNLDQLVSSKAVFETSVGDTIKVRVTLVAEQFENVKILTRSFLVEKLEDETAQITNFMLEGVEENRAGERNPIDGKTLLEYLFPPEIKRYSMFKGESDLNIFNSEDALINLINLFSDAKYFQKYADRGGFLRERADKAVTDASKADGRNMALYNRLETEIKNLENKLHRERQLNQIALDERNNTLVNLQDVERHVANAEALQDINEKIKNIEDKVTSVSNKIQDDYTTSLFDEKWLLLNFESYQNAFSKKVGDLSRSKRKLQSEFDREEGRKEGAAALSAALLEHRVPLPVGTPSKVHMEEMIKEEICKVCNRVAKEGSDEYNYMVGRLEEYLKSQLPVTQKEEKKVLFENDYINRLVNLSTMQEDSLSDIRQIKTKIKERLDFNHARNLEVQDLNILLDEKRRDRQNIIGSEHGGADRLTDVFKNYNGWQNDIKTINRDINDHEINIANYVNDLSLKKQEKANIDRNTVSSTLLKTQEVLRDIEQIFLDTKEAKFDEFILLLQAKSNEFFDKLNKGSFSGYIHFNKSKRGDKTTLKTELLEGGNILYKPNQSLLTSMHISILFAIADLTKTVREQSYPLIFDAPTSSFDEAKTGEFLNIIYESGIQIILLSKEYIVVDPITDQLSIKEEFKDVKKNKAFWIRLQRPFDKHNLKTLNTEVISY